MAQTRHLRVRSISISTYVTGSTVPIEIDLPESNQGFAISIERVPDSLSLNICNNRFMNTYNYHYILKVSGTLLIQT